MKKKVTSAAAILSLALAIGACTSAFRLIDALLLRPLPVRTRSGCTRCLARASVSMASVRTCDSWAYPAFRLMRAAVKDQAELIAVSYTRAHGSDLRVGSGDGESLPAIRLRLDVRLVRTAARRWAGCSPKTTISSRARIPTPCSPTTIGRAASAAIPKSIGRTFRMGDNLYEIVGVAPEPFTGTETGTVTDIFVPTMMHPCAVRG